MQGAGVLFCDCRYFGLKLETLEAQSFDHHHVCVIMRQKIAGELLRGGIPGPVPASIYGLGAAAAMTHQVETKEKDSRRLPMSLHNMHMKRMQTSTWSTTLYGCFRYVFPHTSTFHGFQGSFIDGRLGWPELAPFDAIHVGAASPEIPKPLIDQLKPGGRMVILVGSFFQDLEVVDKKLDGYITVHTVTSARYVPLTSRAAQLQGY